VVPGKRDFTPENRKRVVSMERAGIGNMGKQKSRVHVRNKKAK